MPSEIIEAGETLFQPSGILEKDDSEIWNGREVRVVENSENLNFGQSKIASFDSAKNRSIVQTVSRAAPVPIRWNHESFPTPPTKPILTPVPDGNTCIRYANSFKDHLLEWMFKSFVEKDLMEKNDYYHIESILQMLVDEVENYTLMVGFYNTDIDWKEVLHPLNRLFQFWNYK